MQISDILSFQELNGPIRPFLEDGIPLAQIARERTISNIILQIGAITFFRTICPAKFEAI